MKIKQLRGFLTVADTLSFVTASERLHISQSALSVTIKSLEADLGGKLFGRTTRRVRLTPEGEALLPLARKLIADWESVQSELQHRFSLGHSRVSVAAMPSFAASLLPPVLRLFRDSHPHISVQVHDVINERVMDMLQVGEVELGVGFEPSFSSLAFEPLYLDRFIAIVPPDSRFAEYSIIHWRDLLESPFIALQRPSAVRILLEDSLLAVGIELRVDYESHHLSTVGKMVASGLGVSVVPALCAQHMTEVGAKILQLDAPEIERHVGILWRPGQEWSVATTSLYDTLIGTCKGVPINSKCLG